MARGQVNDPLLFVENPAMLATGRYFDLPEVSHG